MTRIMIKVAAASIGLILLAGCELGPKDTAQVGYRGTGMNLIVDKDNVPPPATIPPIAYPLPPEGGDPASSAYQNVPVLGSMSKDRFDHMMAQITQWVAPAEQGCNYCHNPENMASDEKYTKIVARRMLLMTRQINTSWSSHVKQTGVTCFTCHRGQPVPANIWAQEEGPPNPRSIRGNKHGQNTPNPVVAYAALPSGGFSAYLAGKENIRVASTKALPSDHKASIHATEKTYGLMMHTSQALGVNCTFCHNSQSFAAWNRSRAQRAQAWYGIRMVRDANNSYITPLASVFPANRKGPMGDPYKVNCTTCHQGVNKPLGGVSMTDQAPWLIQAPAAAAPAPAPSIAMAPATETQVAAAQ